MAYVNSRSASLSISDRFSSIVKMVKDAVARRQSVQPDPARTFGPVRPRSDRSGAQPRQHRRRGPRGRLREISLSPAVNLLPDGRVPSGDVVLLPDIAAFLSRRIAKTADPLQTRSDCPTHDVRPVLTSSRGPSHQRQPHLLPRLPHLFGGTAPSTAHLLPGLDQRHLTSSRGATRDPLRRPPPPGALGPAATPTSSLGLPRSSPLAIPPTARK